MLDTPNCTLFRSGFAGYINKEIKTDISFFGLVNSVGWVNTSQYYLLGDRGIEIGNTSKDCRITERTLWSWNYRHWDNKLRYNLAGNLGNYDRRPGHIDQRIQKKYSNVVFLQEGDRLKFIMPNNYGGLWYGEVSTAHPGALKRLLHIFVYNQLVIFLYVLVGLFLLFRLQQMMAVKSKKSV